MKLFITVLIAIQCALFSYWLYVMVTTVAYSKDKSKPMFIRNWNEGGWILLCSLMLIGVFVSYAIAGSILYIKALAHFAN